MDINREDKIKNLIKTAKNKGMIKSYTEFSKTESGLENALNEEEEEYYISNNEKNIKTNFEMGDIVFVTNYQYKNGNSGKNHSFVIIDANRAVDINYFGFLISSKINKLKYPYNKELKKNNLNNLYQDSIVKCDDLIEINQCDIKFKIGIVSKSDLDRFINTYIKYLNEKS